MWNNFKKIHSTLITMQTAAHQWFPSDTVTIIAGFLDPKHYVRLLSACKLTRDKLTPGRAAVVFPLALKHIHRLILAERYNTVEPLFKLEKTEEKSNGEGLGINLLHFSWKFSQENTLNTYFFLSIEKSAVKINVNRWRDTVNSEYVGTPGTFSVISIEPSKDHPFKSGTISLTEISADDDNEEEEGGGEPQDTETTTIWEYRGDFVCFIPEVVSTMCSLDKGFYH